MTLKGINVPCVSIYSVLHSCRTKEGMLFTGGRKNTTTGFFIYIYGTFSSQYFRHTGLCLPQDDQTLPVQAISLDYFKRRLKKMYV